MSLITICDIDGCNNCDHSYDGAFYNLSKKAMEATGWTDICEECLPQYLGVDYDLYLGNEDDIYSDQLFTKEEKEDGF